MTSFISFTKILLYYLFPYSDCPITTKNSFLCGSGKYRPAAFPSLFLISCLPDPGVNQTLKSWVHVDSYVTKKNCIFCFHKDTWSKKTWHAPAKISLGAHVNLPPHQMNGYV